MLESVLVGRDHEVAVVRSCLASASSGTSSVIVVEGEPGIGKSALLAEARTTTEGVVLSTIGVESESDIACVNLADVFRHHYTCLNTIPERQAEALASFPSSRFR
jgi:predicted ATP-dependent serine protease